VEWVREGGKGDERAWGIGALWTRQKGCVRETKVSEFLF